MKANWKWSE